jgi:hypothetical protein
MISPNVENIYEKLNKVLQKFKDKHKSSMNEVFKFSPKIMMNLLLNFESFDQTTAIRDVYMPEEKVINYNVGYIKLNFIGKLRLTTDRANISNNKISKLDTSTGPSKTYGVIEDKGINLFYFILFYRFIYKI